MGYYTKFDLTIADSYDHASKELDINDEEKEMEILRRLGEISRLYDPNDDEDYIIDFFNFDEYKWNNHEVDMIDLSKEYSDYWFILEGHGEEWDDIWKEMYHNGKGEYIRAEIVYSNFSGEEHWK